MIVNVMQDDCSLRRQRWRRHALAENPEALRTSGAPVTSALGVELVRRNRGQALWVAELLMPSVTRLVITLRELHVKGLAVVLKGGAVIERLGPIASIGHVQVVLAGDLSDWWRSDQTGTINVGVEACHALRVGRMALTERASEVGRGAQGLAVGVVVVKNRSQNVRHGTGGAVGARTRLLGHPQDPALGQKDGHDAHEHQQASDEGHRHCHVEEARPRLAVFLSLQQIIFRGHARSRAVATNGALPRCLTGPASDGP
mmetsp:Transcript_31622/g.87265  ORF Transcript_31622/g.87265 Transcript_31622/m.87265 type:complete len:258 (-) Transcript_31622:1-774(-)